MSGAEIEAAPDLAQKLTKTLPRSRRIWFPFLLLLHGFYTNFAKKIIGKILNFFKTSMKIYEEWMCVLCITMRILFLRLLSESNASVRQK